MAVTYKKLFHLLIDKGMTKWSVPDQPPDQCVHSPLISACQSLITA